MKKLFVCALAVAMVFAFTAPTMAAEWNFYGSARFDTFSVDQSKEGATPGWSYVIPKGTGTAYGDTDTVWTVAQNSRIGANVSAGDVGGRFEYGVDGGVNLRLLYGTWNFGAGTLIVGQDYTPISEFYSNQVFDADIDLLPYGMAYNSRKPQIKLRFGGFDVAFIVPNTGTTAAPITGATLTTSATTGKTTAIAYTVQGGDQDTVLPKIALSYKFATDMFSVKPYLGWQSIEFNKGTLDNMESVDSLVYGVGGKVNFGPAYVAANIWGGTNAGNYGMFMASEGRAAWTGTQLKDNDTLAYAAVVGFKASDMFIIEGGYGYTKSEIDYAPNKLEDDASSYYINCTINLAPGVFVVPEFGKYDHGETKQGAWTFEKGDLTYFGAKWQINF